MNTFLEESLKHLSPFVNLFPDKLLTPPINNENQQMDSDVYLSNLSIKALNKFAPKESTIEDKRQSILALSKIAGGKTISVGKVVDLKIERVKVRYYRPKSIPDQAELPVMVYAHGGGWATGSIQSHDNTTRFFASRANIAVVSVEYALAPEAPFPQGLNDYDKVVTAIMAGELKGVNPQKVAVAGDSAGGNLATAFCLRRAHQDLPQPAMQVLFSPALNLSEFDSPSHQEFSSGHFLTREDIELYRDYYLADGANPKNFEVSPLYAPRHLLKKLAPVYMATAGFDPLRDECRAYAYLLNELGVETSLVVHYGTEHPFISSLAIWDSAYDAGLQAVSALRIGLEHFD